MKVNPNDYQFEPASPNNGMPEVPEPQEVLDDSFWSYVAGLVEFVQTGKSNMFPRADIAIMRERLQERINGTYPDQKVVIALGQFDTSEPVWGLRRAQPHPVDKFPQEAILAKVLFGNKEEFDSVLQMPKL